MAILLGALAGLGLILAVLGLIPRPVRTPVVTASKDGKAKGSSSKAQFAGAKRGVAKLTGRMERDLQSKVLLVQDAAMVGRSLETHALNKLIGLVVGAALLGAGGFFVNALGLFSLHFLLIIAAALVGGLLGWILPDSALKTEAEKERVLFQQVTEAWLELVAQLVTAGADTFAALGTAASYSDQPGFVTIRDALRSAAAHGEPPWSGLTALSNERRLRFLDPFCSALELAGTTGAGSRQAIMAQVDAARSKAMLEADAAAASSGEKMGAPLALIGGAFMVLMGYPPMAGILDTSQLGGL